MKKVFKKISFYVKDFKSTQDLAKYLLKVSEDDMLFASYFWWREHYKVQVFFDITGIGLKTSLSRQVWNPENCHGANSATGYTALEENLM